MLLNDKPAHSAIFWVILLPLLASLASPAPAQAPPAPAGAPAMSLTATSPPTNSPTINGIAHIAIRVKDIAASVDFYHKLGFEQAFANTSKDGVVTQSFLKINDRQFIELYPVTDREPQVGFLHLCFEGADLNALHDFYIAEGLAPISVRTAGAGNLLFTMKGPLQFAEPQNIEYTQYMPGSRHSSEFGQHLGPDRVGDRMTVVALAVQDPVAARSYYLVQLGFTASKSSPARLDLPGTSGQAVEIVPVAELGSRSSIVLNSNNLDRAAAQLTRQQVPFQRAASSATDAQGKTLTIDMLAVRDPDGNILRIQSAR